MNILEGAALFAEIAVEVKHKEYQALENGCVILEAEAKRVLGTHDYNWPPLKPETVARKATGDSPLLETGALRDSIHHSVEGRSGFVGSNEDTALYQELGTSRGIPPRPFLMGAAAHKGAEIKDAIGEVLFSVFKR